MGKDILQVLYHIFSMEVCFNCGCTLELPEDLIKDTHGQASVIRILECRVHLRHGTRVENRRSTEYILNGFLYMKNSV